MPRPFFTIVVTTYNRAKIVDRCVASCFAQTLLDFEVIVVDDGSTDETASALSSLSDPRLRVLRHERNRGIHPSRFTGASQAQGEWIVLVDSDWELFPHALSCFQDIIRGLPHGVRVVGARLLWDDGHISPAFVPDRPVDYEGRIRWVEAAGDDDDVRCFHRSVFAATPYFDNRRGAMESLYELDLARNETVLYVEDVLGREHTDASNSYLRGVDREELIRRLRGDAPDMLWMAEMTLREHGEVLKQYGPRQHRDALRVAAREAFLTGDRRKGLGYSLKCLRLKISDARVWGTLILGLVCPTALGYGTFAYRKLGVSRTAHFVDSP